VNRRASQRLLIPGARAFLRWSFASRLLKYRWRVWTLAVLLIAGPVTLAMWLVPYSWTARVKLNRLDPGGIVTHETGELVTPPR
jgi:hypothetical protein